MGPDNGKPDSRIQTPLPKSEAGGAHWSRPCIRRLWDSLLFETENRFETARVVSQGPVGFRAWAESSLSSPRTGLENCFRPAPLQPTFQCAAAFSSMIPKKQPLLYSDHVNAVKAVLVHQASVGRETL